MHPLLNIAINAARQAANVINRAMNQMNNIAIERKSGHDLVTSVDKAAEETIISVIKKAYPGHSILAEESGADNGDDNVWIIDPIDGTINFIHGIPHFAISIALQQKGVLEHGVVFDPIKDELFTASRGRGAMLNNTRMRMQETPMKSALIATGSPFIKERDTTRLRQHLTILERVAIESTDIRFLGSAALNLAYLAAGRVDGFYEYGLKPWDIAAGALLVREAGGFVAGPNNSDNFLDTGDIIAGGRKTFGKLQDIVSPS